MSALAEKDPLRDLPRPDTVIGRRFRLGGAIGQGGMSAVFSARDQRLERDVAFKILTPELACSREIVTRFVNEARTLARLDCPHVVRVLDAGVTSEPGTAALPYMVLELLRGEDLRTHCERGPLEVERALDFVLQTCEGLAAAHAEGVVHRDLKPENLFLCAQPDGTELVKILDFGIARSLAAPASLTLSGEGMGSPGYMSPEQLRDASAADERSDIWSLGVVLHELLAGVPPFQAATPFDLCAHILAGQRERLERRRPELPAQLVAVVDRCLELEPERRYQSVVELAAALEPFVPGGAPALARIRHRLLGRESGEVPALPHPLVDVQAPTEPVIHEDEAALPLPPIPLFLAHPRKRHRVAQALAGLSLIAMLALLSHVFGAGAATPRLDDAQSSVLKLSERMSAAAHDFLRTGARTPEAAPPPAEGQEGPHR
jgi:serine/threonine-protein kinase